MRNFIKKITHPFLKTGLDWYYSKPRKYHYGSSFVWVHPEVFPPRLTFSTKILLDFLQTKTLKDKTFLELGCGSGIISVFAARQGAHVTATDINKTALGYLARSAAENHVRMDILRSDLFEDLPGKSFDCIVINPPYYPQNAKTIKDMAWFCGEHFEYFAGLFAQLPDFMTTHNEVLMILSQDCQIDTIQSMAAANGIGFKLMQQTTVYGERNFIFSLLLQA